MNGTSADSDPSLKPIIVTIGSRTPLVTRHQFVLTAGRVVGKVTKVLFDMQRKMDLEEVVGVDVGTKMEQMEELVYLCRCPR